MHKQAREALPLPAHTQSKEILIPMLLSQLVKWSLPPFIT